MDVLRIEVSKRLGDLNFITAIRKAFINNVPECGKNGN